VREGRAWLGRKQKQMVNRYEKLGEKDAKSLWERLPPCGRFRNIILRRGSCRPEAQLCRSQSGRNLAHHCPKRVDVRFRVKSTQKITNNRLSTPERENASRGKGKWRIHNIRLFSKHLGAHVISDRCTAPAQ
jgi:hypothetical protein